MDTQKKTFHCKTTTEQELTGKKILQNCRNQLYLDFPYLDGAFTSLEYKADSSIDTIGTDGELIYFNPVFLMKKYLEDPAAVRRGYLHMLLHCLYLHIFMEPDRDSGEWDRECDCFVEQLIDKAVGEGKISLKKRKSDDTQVNTNTFDDHIFWQRTAGQASGGRRTKEKWEHILAYTSQNKTGMQSRAGTQTNDQQEELDEIYYVYVIDDDERLRGIFPLKKMITSPSVSKVKHVMQKDPISVHVDTPIDEVVQAIEKYDLVAIPVVDSIGRLVGQITVDDVMDEVREQSERDYQLASGLSQDVETDDNVLRQTTARLPWLLIGMIGGIGNSMILGNFDSTFAAHPEMALYIPLIGGTGGNVGTQSSAIIVQGLANSSLDAKNTFKQITKESVVALINATIISLLVYTYNFIRFGATATVTYSVSISLFAVVMFASIFGTLVPMTLEKFKIDPAIATGPFIAITNDIIGMMLYMGITVLLS